MEFKTKWKANLQIWKVSAWPHCKERGAERSGWVKLWRPYPEELVKRWLVWIEGSQVLFIRIMEESPKGFSKAVTPLQKHRTGLRVKDSIIGDTEQFHGSVNHEFNCIFCLTQSCTMALTLPWWCFSLSRCSVGFDSCPCGWQSLKTLVVSIWFSLCQPTVS
jgi:hypothetical protein